MPCSKPPISFTKTEGKSIFALALNPIAHNSKSKVLGKANRNKQSFPIITFAKANIINPPLTPLGLNTYSLIYQVSTNSLGTIFLVYSITNTDGSLTFLDLLSKDRHIPYYLTPSIYHFLAIILPRLNQEFNTYVNISSNLTYYLIKSNIHSPR